MHEGKAVEYSFEVTIPKRTGAGLVHQAGTEQVRNPAPLQLQFLKKAETKQSAKAIYFQANRCAAAWYDSNLLLEAYSGGDSAGFGIDLSFPTRYFISKFPP
jgi:hypothetical protein